MIRRLFTIVSANSLLLCLASAATWIYGQWRWDQFVMQRGGYGCWFGIEHNRINIQIDHTSAGPFPTVTTSRHGNQRTDPFEGYRTTTGFVYDKRQFGQMTVFILFLPIWMLVIIFAVLPVFHLIVVKRRKGMGNTSCPTCGYDLRASKDRCPECGTPFSQRAKGTE